MLSSKSLSLAKAVSWRVAGSLATVAIVYFATDKLELAAAVGGAETVVKIGLFYVHERIWARLVEPTSKEAIEKTEMIIDHPADLMQKAA